MVCVSFLREKKSDDLELENAVVWILLELFSFVLVCLG